MLDCGNGAAFRLAPDLFRRLGAEVHTICGEPNGRNINQGCGALHLEPLQQAVRERGADFGVAFDGDADRAIFVARSGKLVDGDAVLLIAARDMKAAGRLAGNLVVATVMSNLGLEKALEREGIRLLRTPVGDKYVLEEMVRTGAVLGGEQSGHVIFRQHATTGDGLLTALRVFEIAVKSGKGLDELTADLEIYPQRLKNVRVSRRKPLDELPEVVRQIKDCEAEFAGAGRVLVRFSGTEPLARVMVEGPNLEQVERFHVPDRGGHRTRTGLAYVCGRPPGLRSEVAVRRLAVEYCVCRRGSREDPRGPGVTTQKEKGASGYTGRMRTFILTMVFTVAAFAQTRSKPVTPNEQWVPLFNGKDLTVAHHGHCCSGHRLAGGAAAIGFCPSQGGIRERDTWRNAYEWRACCQDGVVSWSSFTLGWGTRRKYLHPKRPRDGRT